MTPFVVIQCFFRSATEMSINYFYGFAAFMINHMTWGGANAESFLEVDLKLNLTLEVGLMLIKYINIAYPITSIFLSLSWG